MEAGRFFENLDLLSQLIVSDKAVGEREAVPPPSILIEDLTGKVEGCNTENTVDVDGGLSLRKKSPPSLSPLSLANLNLGVEKYGFIDLYCEFYERFPEQMNEILELLSSPDKSTLEKRREEKAAKEDNKFDEDAYLIDLCDEEGAVKAMLSYNPWFRKDSALEDIMEKLSVTEEQFFSKEDQDLMRQLPRKDYCVKDPTVLIYGLVDIVLAYCYELRFTHDDFNVESTWTICKLSSTLSCLEVRHKYAASESLSHHTCILRNFKMSSKYFTPWQEEFYAIHWSATITS